MDLLLLCIFAFFAGFVDAIVGGGGLIQLPALFILQPHLSLAQTLATNKTASFFGTTVAATRYGKRVKINWRRISPAIITAFFSAFGGAMLVSKIHKEQFMPFIMFALAAVLCYTLLKKELGLHHREKMLPGIKHLVYSIFIGMVIGFYEGLIGPGTGSFLIFIYVVIFGFNFLHASANAKIVNWTASLGALIFFFFQGYAVWTVAIPIAIANMLGNYAGAHLALKKGSGFVKVFYVIVSLVLIFKLGYDYFH